MTVVECLLFFTRLLLIEACNTDIPGPKSSAYLIDPDIVDGAQKSPREPYTPEDYFPNHLSKRPWTYDRQSSWKCIGTRQSPIDLNTTNVKSNFHNEFIKFGPLNLTNYYKPMPAIGFNNGNTLQFISMSTNSTELRVTGGPLEHMYRLEQIHYHSPSEHSIDGQKYFFTGRRYTMEIHLVHIRVDLEVDEALSEKDGLAILAVFWKVIMGWRKPWLKDVDLYSELKIPGNKVDVALNVWEIMPKNLLSYYTYSGSLSTPPCQEVVTWIIFDTPVDVPENLFRAFGTIGVSRKNFREIQLWQAHKVYRTPTLTFLTPLISDAMSKPLHSLAVSKFWRTHKKFYNWFMRYKGILIPI